MEQLSGLDSMLLYSEQVGLSQNITGIYIYDPSTAPGKAVAYEDIVKLFEAHLDDMPSLRRRLYELPLDLDWPYWIEDVEVDVSRHIHHLALPEPGDWSQLCKLVAHLHSLPMDYSRPLWEIYVIDGLDKIEGCPPGCFAVARKYHHCALDGATYVRLDEMLHDSTARPSSLRGLKRGTPRLERPAPLQVWRNALRNTLNIPARLSVLARGVISTEINKRELDAGPTATMPKTRFQGPIGRQRVIDGLMLDFAELRDIKSAVPGASINDVLLAITSGALRAYLESKGELPEESLICACPVDIRSDAERDTDGNVVGVMSIPMHSEIADPLQRLETVHRDALSIKARGAAGETRISHDLFAALPSQLTSLFVRAISSKPMMERGLWGNTVLSNVPGSRSQYYLRGARLVGVLPGAPLEAGVGLLHIAMSNVLNGTSAITLGFASTPEMMPDPEFYRECLRTSFEELKAATGAGRRRRKKR